MYVLFICLTREPIKERKMMTLKYSKTKCKCEGNNIMFMKEDIFVSILLNEGLISILLCEDQSL